MSTSALTEAMPELLILARHGEAAGQLVRDQQAQDTSGYTEEFRNTSTIRHNLTRDGFAQAKSIASYLARHILNSNVLPAGIIDRGLSAATHRARQSLGAVLLEGVRMDIPIIREVTGSVDRIGTEGTDDWPDFWVTSDPRLNEIEFGWHEASPRAEMDAAYPDAATARARDHFTARPPGGESPADVLARARDTMGAVTRMHAKGVKSVYMSTHGRFRTMFDFAIRGLDALDWDEFNRQNKVENAELLFLARRNPLTGEPAPTLRWRATANPWRDPDTPPVWEEFVAPRTIGLENLLRGIPQEWRDDQPADRNGRAQIL
ncbi:MAG TPA: histidine phosphatase family protein [Nitrososphaera sp.]|nr:histidine phosphatase family protein [Nitrososphaera sp.]